MFNAKFPLELIVLYIEFLFAVLVTVGGLLIVRYNRPLGSYLKGRGRDPIHVSTAGRAVESLFGRHIKFLSAPAFFTFWLGVAFFLLGLIWIVKLVRIFAE